MPRRLPMRSQLTNGLLPFLAGLALTGVMLLTVPALWRVSEGTIAVEDRHQMTGLQVAYNDVMADALGLASAQPEHSAAFEASLAQFRADVKQVLDNPHLRSELPDFGAQLVLASEALDRRAAAQDTAGAVAVLAAFGPHLGAYQVAFDDLTEKAAAKSSARLSQIVRVIVIVSGALLSLSVVASLSFLARSRGAHRQSRLLTATVAELAEAQRISRLGTISWDFVTDEVRYSDQVAEIYGLEPGEMLSGRDFTALLLPEDTERVILSEKRALARSALTGRPEIREISHRIRRSDGRIVDIWARSEISAAADGSPRRMVSTVRDITEEEAQRRTLAESERSLALAQRISRLGRFRHLVREDKVWWSDEMYQLLGYPPEGGPVAPREMIHEDDRSAVAAALRRMNDAAGPQSERTVTLTFRMRHRNGDVHHFRCAAAMTYDANGAQEEMTGTLIDITDQVHQEERLQEALREAHRANNAKSDFLAVMSHELRTPLNGILGMLGGLEAASLPPGPREQVKIARGSANALLEILNDILDMSKIEAGKLETEAAPFQVFDMVRSLRQLYAYRVEEKGLSFDLQIGPEVPAWVSADAPRILQILSNLISNAIKFTPAGSVTLRVTALPDPDDAEEVRLQFAVTDTGIGIPLEKQKHVFERFNQLDLSYNRRFGGTGLGLSICRSLTEIMRGDLTFNSIPGYGSTFTLTVPCASVATPPQREAAAPPEDLRRMRVLVVDDNRVNQVVARQLLARLGQDCEVANDGLEAVEAASATAFDLILMDLSMPRMDGYQALARIRALDGAQGRLPVVALTGHAGEAERTACRNAGFDGVLIKPLMAEALRAELAKIPDTERPVLPVNQPPLNTPALSPPADGAPPLPPAAADPAPAQHARELASGLANLTATLGEDLLLTLLEAALSDIARYLDNLDSCRARTQSDRDTLRATFHSVVGLAGNLGCVSLAREALELEQISAVILPQPARINLLESVLHLLVERLTEVRAQLLLPGATTG